VPTTTVASGGARAVGPAVRRSPAALLALQRLAGNRAASTLAVQRQGNAKVQAAIDGSDPVALGELPREEFRSASDDQRFRAVTILLDNNKGGVGQIRADAGIPNVWDGFGANLEAVVAQRPAEWERSLKEKRSITVTSTYFQGLRARFWMDVQHVVGGYLNENEQFCHEQLPKLGLDPQGKILAGPPSPKQLDELNRLRPEAQKIAADREAMSALRAVECGYTVKESLPGGVGMEGDRAKFDPAARPKAEPQPGDGMKSWDEVNGHYQELHKLVAARLAANPVLAALDREHDEARAGTQTVATGTREEALEQLGRSLSDTLDNIKQTRGLLSPTTVQEFKPVHQQLVMGTVPKIHQPQAQWAVSPALKPAGEVIVGELTPDPVETVVKAVGMFALYAVIGFATGGVALAVGTLASDAVETAVAAGKAEALASAAGTNLTADTTLVTRGQVDEAKAELIEKAAFAFLDLAGAMSAVRGALKEIVQFEKQAAEAAARARAAADKWIAAETKTAAGTVLAEAEAAAKEARTAADNAAGKKGTAGPNETARAQAATEAAQKDAAAAEAVAADMQNSVKGELGKSGHAEPVKVGDHTVGTRGVWVTRCSKPPCAELAASILERAKGLRVKGATPNPAHWVLNEQLDSLAKQSAAFGERAKAQLTKTPIGHPKRVQVERALNAEGAALEQEMQRLENLVRSGNVEATSLRQGIHAVASALERNLVDRARAIFPNMPKAPGKKCVAMSESGTPMVSGYKYNPNAAADVAEHAAIIDAALVENKSFDRGVPGRASASHSEKMAGIRQPGEPIAVALPMCPNCYAYFAAEARASGVTQVVAEPHLTNVFFADGTRVSIDPGTGARTVIGQGQSISTGTNLPRPTGQ
jgi:hypothetical protein